MQSRGEEERKLSLAAESNRCQLGEMREERGEDDERRAGKEGGRRKDTADWVKGANGAR